MKMRVTHIKLISIQGEDHSSYSERNIDGGTGGGRGHRPHTFLAGEAWPPLPLFCKK